MSDIRRHIGRHYSTAAPSHSGARKRAKIKKLRSKLHLNERKFIINEVPKSSQIASRLSRDLRVRNMRAHKLRPLRINNLASVARGF